jgi:hypothetical protein
VAVREVDASPEDIREGYTTQDSPSLNQTQIWIFRQRLVDAILGHIENALHDDVVIPSIESVINVSIQPECRTFSCNVF